MLKFSDVELPDDFIAKELPFFNRPKGKPYKRKNEARMTKTQQQRFISSMKALIANGWFNEFVNIHGNMDYHMHTCNMMTGSCSLIGSYRFLAWHRLYLLILEEKLKEIDKRNFVPYWRWTRRRRFPKWLLDFEPKGLKMLNGMNYDVSRDIDGDKNALPTKDDMKARLSHKTYREFTLALEGMEPRGAHNIVHTWVGGTMNTMYSPADPIFWLHHAECDRLWYIWQLKNADQHPPLTGEDAILTPWSKRYKDVSDLGKLPYTYGQLKV